MRVCYSRLAAFTPMKIVVLIFFMGLMQNVRSAELVDSLKSILPDKKDDLERVDLFNSIAQTYMFQDQDSSLKYSSRALNVARKTGYAKGQADALNLQAGVFRTQSNFPKSLKYSQQALRIYERLKDSVGVARIFSNISSLHSYMGNPEKGLEYVKKSLRLTKALNAKKSYSLSLIGAGICYDKLAIPDSALLCYQEAEKILKENNDYKSLGFVYNNMGAMYVILDSLELAKQFYLRGLELRRKFENKWGMIYSLNGLANIALKSGKSDSTIFWATQGLELATKFGAIQETRTAAYYLREAMIIKEDFRSAIRYDSIYEYYRDSTYSLEKEKALKNQEFEFTLERKEAENEYLREERKKSDALVTFQGITIAAVLVSLIFVIIFAASQYRAKKREKKANEALTRQQEEILKQNQELERLNEAITQQNQEIQAQKADLEELNRLKDRLFSLISHDLKNPLNAVAGTLGLLKSGMINQDEMPVFVDNALAEVNATSGLLQNLLFWAKSQMNGLQPHVDKVDLKGLVKETMDLLSTTAASKDIELEDHLAGEAVVNADYQMTSLVVRNLLSNALKFSYPGEKIQIKGWGENGRFYLSIRDRGIGISDENQDRLFRSLDFSTPGTENEKGTGLGLYLSRVFLNQLGGDVKVESEEGVGSTFTFWLPRD